MREGNRLDQLFLKREGAQVGALLVAENLAGARFRTQLTLPTQDFGKAVELLARHLVNQGEVASVDGARVRLERSGELQDAPDLKAALAAAFRRLLSERE